MNDTKDTERTLFEAWYTSTDDAPAEPERIYKLDEDGMNELTKGCIWLGWQARAAMQEAASPEPKALVGLADEEITDLVTDYFCEAWVLRTCTKLIDSAIRRFAEKNGLTMKEPT